jgi:hypothetical protein
MLGVVLALVTGNPIFDGIGTLAIGLLLVSIAAVLAVEMKSLAGRRIGCPRRSARDRGPDRVRPRGQARVRAAVPVRQLRIYVEPDLGPRESLLDAVPGAASPPRQA